VQKDPRHGSLCPLHEAGEKKSSQADIAPKLIPLAVCCFVFLFFSCVFYKQTGKERSGYPF